MSGCTRTQPDRAGNSTSVSRVSRMFEPCLGAITIMVLLSSPVSAETAAAAAPAPSASDDAANNQIADVIVTARRVSERSQDIPASVSAVSQDQVLRMNSLDNLSSVVGGVTFKSFGPIPVVGLRGFGNRSNTQGPNNTVGIFQDGVFIATFLNALTSRIDVSRIEVAKGPQSTLYGRASYAGAINIVTNEPTPTLSGYTDVGAGGSSANGESLWHVRAAISGPVTDTLTARAFFMHEERQGYTYDPDTHFRGYGNDRTAGRIKLKWQPSDDLTIGVAGTVMHDDATRGDIHGTIQPQLGGRTLFGDPRFVPTFTSGPDIWRGTFLREPRGDVDGQQGTMDIRYQTPIGEIALLSDYTHAKTFIKTINDTSVGNFTDVDTITDEKRFSQEARLSGKSDGFSYLAGLYYLHSNFNFGRAGNTLDLSAPFSQFYPGSAQYDLSRLQALYTPTQNFTDAYAGFGQLGYDFTDKLNLTAGLRRSRDDLSGTTQSTALLQSGALATSVPKTYRSAGFDATTGSVNLSYKLVPGTLVYSSYSRGDSPGGFNNGAAALINFTPQKVNAYEVGVKSDLFDRRVRVNLALFDNEYSNLQFFQAIVLGGISTQVTTNAAKARGRGFDLDTTVLLSNSFRVGVQYTDQTSKITSYKIPPPPAPHLDFTGIPLVRSPKDSLNVSATFTHEIGPGEFQLTAEESYTSSYTNDYTGVPAGSAYPGRAGVPPGVTTSQVLDLFRGPGYTITDLNASYTIRQWELSAYVRNLLNRQYIVATVTTDAFTYPLEAPGEPRTFEISAKWSF